MTSKNTRKNTRIWMVLSGLSGLAFFLIANFSPFFHESKLLAACIQLSINVFVFLSWRRGFHQHTGRAKAFALIGTCVPVAMASITVCRVILPTLFSFFTRLATYR